MKRRWTIVLFLAVGLVVALVVWGLTGEPLRWRGSGMLAIEKSKIDSAGDYNPFHLLDEILAISNAVSTAEFKAALSTAAGIEPRQFELQTVQQFRSTSIVDLSYAAGNRESAWQVASNACSMVKHFYSTNRTNLQIDLVDVRVFRPPPLWQVLLDDLTRQVRW